MYELRIKYFCTFTFQQPAYLPVRQVTSIKSNAATYYCICGVKCLLIGLRNANSLARNNVLRVG